MSAVVGNTDHMRSPAYTFAPNNEAQFKMISQLTNNIDFTQQNYIPSAASFTPQLSSISTPGSTFSAPLRQQKQKDENTEPGSPATVVSATAKADPFNQYKFVSRRGWTGLDGTTNVLDAGALSEQSNSNPNWLPDIDLHSTQLQQQGVPTTYNDQHFNYGDTFSPSSLSHSRFSMTGNEEPTQSLQLNVGPNAITSTAKNEGCLDSGFGPFLMAEEFLSPPIQDNYTFSVYGNNDSFMKGNGQNGYMQSQVGTTPYIANGFDFNDLESTSGSYGLGVMVSPNTQPPKHGSSSHAVQQSNRARQNNRDAELDQKLIAWRRAGMTYKQIKEKGNFGLEESTLRGRYRTLTKGREQRLRKPDWPTQAVNALREGVELLGPAVVNGSSRKETLDRVPWKRVAEWMNQNRNCYLYGNATVKKKYKELLDNNEF
ncbi:hypothetical protein H2198_001345 [Neophaeococcomyces mojaviensis]|uniref:Uncharacterized protein n=1 Tax=Neophaeococcomyces mojaviensis TaxID=3383035 RepID=A0ACC3AHN7_9EURO|nr:hypothetical protein H2198_001345 [Knufia sp. JES_112]